MKELIKPGILKKDDKILMVNAFYFKADWANGFDEGLTKPKHFFL